MPRITAIPTLALAILVLGCSPASNREPVTAPPAVEEPSPTGLAPTPERSTATPAPTPTASASPGSPSERPVVAWVKLDVSGPSAREDHTWTVDGAGRNAYLFGGRAGSKTRGDLWRYDLASDAWLQLDPQGAKPKPRFGHSAVWVDGVGLVIWAGQAGSAFFDDLWAYDPAADAWRELPSTGAVPEPRYGSCAVVGQDRRLWISHGFTDTGRFFDTRAYDFASGRWTDETPKGPAPVERCLHECLWSADGRLLLYAGQTTGVPALADLWAFDPEASAWAELKPSPKPSARQLYALASDGATAWVLGGAGKDRGKLDDLWALDLATLAWRSVEAAGTGPSARSGATLIADPDRERLLLFGGVSAKDELRDTWQLALPGSTD